MAPHKEDIVGDDDIPSVNPYEVLGLEKTATADQVKSAYRKAALKNHPGKEQLDSYLSYTSSSCTFLMTEKYYFSLLTIILIDKAPENLKDTAHAKFQEIAFAYAILSDPTRRKRFDTTGSTSESIVDSDGFSWSDFYSEQFQDVISSDAIEKFSKKYKGSDEEKDDILDAYQQTKGNMSKLYEIVILSNAEEDEERFRAIIDAAIEEKDVKAYKAYVNESEKERKLRIQHANAEEGEAMAYAEELGVAEKLFGKKGKKDKKNGGEDALMALIQKRQQDRAGFFDHLEAKYGGKQEDDDGPSEEAFQKAAARLKKKKPVPEVTEGRRAKRAKHEQ